MELPFIHYAIMEVIPIDSPQLAVSVLSENGSLVGERFGVSSLLCIDPHVNLEPLFRPPVFTNPNRHAAISCSHGDRDTDSIVNMVPHNPSGSKAYCLPCIHARPAR